MIPRYGCRVDDRARADDVARIVSPMHLGAGTRHVRRRSRIAVASGDRHTPPPGHERQGTHPRAGYPKEMDGAGIVRGEKTHWLGS
jgi:hypothetical protein